MNYLIRQAENGVGDWNKDLFLVFMRDIRRFPTFKGNEACEHIRKMRLMKDPEKQRLMWELTVLRNVPLVVSVAFKWLWAGKECGLMLSDLVQEGVFGLMRAIEKYDPNMGFHFSTYATQWIQQAIRRALSNSVSTRPFRVPVHFHDLILSIKGVMREKMRATGESPEPHIIYAELKKKAKNAGQKPPTMKAVGQALGVMALSSVSLDTPMETHGNGGDSWEGSTLYNYIPANFPAPDHILEAKEQLLAFRAVIKSAEDFVETLPPRTQEVISLRLGLFGKNTLVLDEIGERYGISRERIRQIEKTAMPKLEAAVGFTRDELKYVLHTAERLEAYVLSAT